MKTGMWGIFWNALYGPSVYHSKNNFKNNYLIFKPNYFISFLITTLFSY